MTPTDALQPRPSDPVGGEPEPGVELSFCVVNTSQRELLLRGESANAGRLVTMLEESKVFVEAARRRREVA